MSHDLDQELQHQMQSFQQIDELVHKQAQIPGSQPPSSQNYIETLQRKTRNSPQHTASNSAHSLNHISLFPNTIPSIVYDQLSADSSNPSLKFSIGQSETYMQPGLHDHNPYLDAQPSNLSFQSENEEQSIIQLSQRSGMRVEERLQTIGKIYQAKKMKVKEEVEQRRKQAEDQIVQKVKRKYSKENFNFIQQQEKSAEPVEKRLINQKQKYDQKALHRQQQRLQEELNQLKQPEINQKSEKMVGLKEEFKLKVEDRLINIGRMWKDKKEIQMSLHIKEVDNRAYPVLTTIKSTEKVKLPLESFEERLKSHIEKKEKMIEELKRKYDYHDTSKSVQHIDQEEFLRRQKEFIEKKQKKKDITVYQEHSKYTFTPRINENSKRMVTSSSKERLLTPNQSNVHGQCKVDRWSKSPVISRKGSQTEITQQRSKTPKRERSFQQEEQLFQPKINERSKQIDQTKIYEDQNNQERWARLYSQHNKLLEKKQEKAKYLQEEVRKSLEKQCTFKPEIHDSSRAYNLQTNSDQGQIYERNLIWHQNRQSKIQQINEITKKEELDGCTFKPQIVINLYNKLQEKTQVEQVFQTDYSQLNTKAIEKFLERCNYAKHLKLENELRASHGFGSGSKWKNQITKPKAPKFMQAYYEQIQALSPNQQISPIKKGSQKLLKKDLNQKHAQKLLQSLISQSNQDLLQQDLLYTIHEADQEASKAATLNHPTPLERNQSDLISQTSRQTYTGAGENYGEEFHNAMAFLHEQLHKIDFSFDHQ